MGCGFFWLTTTRSCAREFERCSPDCLTSTASSKPATVRRRWSLLRELRPDVALVDIAMPGLNGLELAARVMREAPATRLVILSMHGTPGHVAQALRAGVCGYLLKDSAADELPVLLRAVMRGETYLSPTISKQVVDGYLGRTSSPATGGAAGAPDASGLDVLTSRQREILQLVAEGKSTKEVAQLLDPAPRRSRLTARRSWTGSGSATSRGWCASAVRTGLVSSDAEGDPAAPRCSPPRVTREHPDGCGGAAGCMLAL
jgi:DNA-binding NarL/FixJ family response regulator